MRIVTSGEMLAIEQEAETQFGLSTWLLMERAGEAVASEARAMLPEPGNVLVICGKGNNGGDGFVAAKLLSGAGYDVTVFALAKRDDFPPAASKAFDDLPRDVHLIVEPDLDVLDEALIDAHLVIDAIFGFSLRGAVRGVAAEVIERVNAADKLVLSVDLPSGLEADSGLVRGQGIVADATVTFTVPKIGMILHPGHTYVGEMIVADLGIPETLLQGTRFRVVDPEDVRAKLPIRALDAYKGSIGQVLVIAGSRGMPGAAVLIGRAAYRMGAGLVAFAPPQGIVPVLNNALVEAICWPQPETAQGGLSLEALGSLVELSKRYDAVVIGPGLGTEEETVRLVRELIPLVDKPLVLDASGLTALAGDTTPLGRRLGLTVITPHPGEMAVLFGVSTREVLGDWAGYAQRASDELGAVVVLKGARTIISDSTETTINITGNPGLATAGTGDVLTGVIASLVTQGLDIYDASWVGTYLHGLAADLAVDDMNEYSLMASDVIEYLAEAINWIE